MLGSGLFQLLVAFFQAEDIYKVTLAVASISFFLAVLEVQVFLFFLICQNEYTILIAFVLFEICCGVHFPCMGTLRSKYIPEESRSAVMNFFRIPLNLLVIAILKWVDIFEVKSKNVQVEYFKWSSIFVTCGIWLVVATLLQVYLSCIKKKDLGMFSWGKERQVKEVQAVTWQWLVVTQDGKYFELQENIYF
jgi:MFS family permease